MSGRIGGIFPGGPHRIGDGGSAARRIRRVADVAEATGRRGRARARWHRRRRAVLGALAVAAAAGAVGVLAGRGLGADPPERAARADSASALDRAISREVNRTLLELWKMEDAERLGLPGGLP